MHSPHFPVLFIYIYSVKVLSVHIKKPNKKDSKCRKRWKEKGYGRTRGTQRHTPPPFFLCWCWTLKRAQLKKKGSINLRISFKIFQLLRRTKRHSIGYTLKTELEHKLKTASLAPRKGTMKKLHSWSLFWWWRCRTEWQFYWLISFFIPLKKKKNLRDKVERCTKRNRCSPL